MTKRYKIALFLCLSVIALSSQPAAAEPSRLSNGYLLIPRIDVDGHGALELVFRLEFESDFHLVLTEVNQASLNTANSGVFNPLDATIEVDEVLLDSGDSYFIKMGLVSQFPFTIFNLTEVIHLSGPIDNPGSGGGDSEQGGDGNSGNDGSANDDDHTGSARNSQQETPHSG